VRVRAWCVRAGVPGLQPNIAAARSPYGNMNASGVCSAGRRVGRPPYLTEKSPRPTYLVSSYCFRSGWRGTGKKGLKKILPGILPSGQLTLLLFLFPHLVNFMGFGKPVLACAKSGVYEMQVNGRIEGRANNEHRKWKRIVGANK